MFKKHLLIYPIINLLLIVSLISTSFAYFITTGKTDIIDSSGTIGTVKVEPNLYHSNVDENNIPFITNAVEATYIDEDNPGVEMVKDNVFALNVSDPNSNYYIDSLRADFKIQSNVFTYLRVRLVVSEILTFRNNNDELVEIATNVDDINFVTDVNWYYDAKTQYFYLKDKVINNGENNEIINFIIDGLNYNPKSPQYSVQIKLKYEAVQAHLGPQKNWGLLSPPWEGEW